MTKSYHISDILTVISGKMVSLRNMEALYDILNHMTRDNLHTHQLPRVMDECQPFLVEQFPALAAVDVSMIDERNLASEIERIATEHGHCFDVPQLPEGKHVKKHPIAELVESWNEAEARGGSE